MASVKTTARRSTNPNADLGTRARIVLATARLLQRQGYEATGMKEIAREANATLGSIYHFFPGGKQELAVEAIRHSNREYADGLRPGLDSSSDPGEAIIACTRILAEYLRESDWVCGCPVSATALETLGRTPEIQRAVADAYQVWQDLVFDMLRRADIAEDDARALACTIMNTVEGAELACQISRTEVPLLVAGKHLAQLIALYQPAVANRIA